MGRQEVVMKRIQTCAALIVTGGLLVLCAPGCGRTESDGACEQGFFECDFYCVDPGSDPHHCGACGAACAPGERCEQGECRSDPPGEPEDRAVAQPATRPDPGQAPGGMVPLGVEDSPVEKCGSPDGVDLTDCGGVCVNTQTDRSHCGACYSSCPSGTFCRAGVCTSACPAGLTNCGGECVNLKIIWNHCGACDNACDSTEVCSGGACLRTCHPGLTDCGGSCVNLRSDRDHCGACGNECAPDEACDGGVCSSSCGDGLANCGGTCVDLLTDTDHCGECDSACAQDAICINGGCQGQSW
jgi:hypothetical protein